MRSITLSRGKLLVGAVVAVLVGSLAGPAVAAGASHAKIATTSIVDPHSHHAAKVTSSGQLEVTEGSGPRTITGTVQAYPYPASKAFSEVVSVGDGTNALLRAGHAVDITSVTVDNNTSNDIDVVLEHQVGASSTCTGGSVTGPFWSADAPAGTSAIATFPSPLIVTDKCATFFQDAGNGFAFVTVTGWETS